MSVELMFELPDRACILQDEGPILLSSEAWTRPNHGRVRVEHGHVSNMCGTRFDRVRHESTSLTCRTRSIRVLDTAKSYLGHDAGLIG